MKSSRMGIRAGLGSYSWPGRLVWRAGLDPCARRRTQLRIAALFAVNIVLHLLWTPLFFNLRRPDWALIEVPFLWLSVVVMMVALAPFAPMAAGCSCHTCSG